MYMCMGTIHVVRMALSHIKRWKQRFGEHHLGWDSIILGWDSILLILILTLCTCACTHAPRLFQLTSLEASWSGRTLRASFSAVCASALRPHSFVWNAVTNCHNANIHACTQTCIHSNMPACSLSAVPATLFRHLDLDDALGPCVCPHWCLSALMSVRTDVCPHWRAYFMRATGNAWFNMFVSMHMLAAAYCSFLLTSVMHNINTCAHAHIHSCIRITHTATHKTTQIHTHKYIHTF
jgi:hypothetical protein